MNQDDLPIGAPEWWNARYLSGDAPWDTGIVPPEVVALIAGGDWRPGWALDLGCGSGVTSRYLARQGFRVLGVDLALSALTRAHRQAEAERLPAWFCQGDVTDLGFLHVQATLAVDIGCFHATPLERRAVYIASLADHLLPGALYLLYAFEPTPTEAPASRRVGPADLALFAPAFVLRWAQHGLDGDRPAAWYLWQRTHARPTC